MNINFYKNNNMILTTAEIHTLENHFVSFARKEDSWKSFSFPVNNLLNKSALVRDYYFQKYQEGSGLQGGKILEFVLGETFANMLGLNYIGDGIFDNTHYTVTLTGELGKGTGDIHDILILDKSTGKTYNAEIKDAVSRTGESDIKYDENGHLQKPTSTSAKKWDDAWMPILNAFNEDTTVFEHPGHNYPIDKYEDACAEVAKNYFSNVDYLFTHKENKLVVIPMDNFDAIRHMFSLAGSEIRCLNGKNTVKCFTPNYLDKAIHESKYYIEDTANGYIFDASILKFKKARGGGVSSKCDFIPGFKVVVSDITYNEDGSANIPKASILQQNPNISVHFSTVASYKDIVKFFEGRANK